MKHRGRRPHWQVRLRWVVGLALVLLLPAAGGTASSQPATTQPAPLPPLQVVVLVDESGSVSETDVIKEKEAARTIVFSVLAPGSVVSVVGFGSSERDGQSAVDVVCPETTLDAPQKRDFLSTCVDGLHRRSDEEGDGTDHVAALQQALDFVSSGGPEKKVVFLLTDGVLDVRDSPSYGDTQERRQAAASAKVKDVLADLDEAGAQVWPLGFGAVDSAGLSGFAKGKSCTPTASNPHEQVAASSTELNRAVAEAFSSASCVKYGPIDTGTVPPGGSVELTVDIPAVASDASIVVYKRDRRVQVEYRPPNSDQPAPASGGSHFEFAGQSTETESLRITDPEPGRWTIRLSSAEVPAQDVAASVVYQATVKANITLSSPQPVAGQTVVVEMQVWARGRAVTDPEVLRGLSFEATLTGSAGFPPQRATLSDPDSNGTFSGPLTVPAGVTGNLMFTGQVSGIGIGGDTRERSTSVQSTPPTVVAQILFDSNRATVTPGGAVTGTVSVSNDSGKPANLRFSIADPTDGAELTIDPGELRADNGSSTIPFTLRFGADTPLGSHGGTLRVVDGSNSDAIVAERLFATDVAPEPGVFEKLFWLWVALVALLLVGLLFLLVRMRSRNERRKVRGLRVQLVRNGSVASELEPRDPNGKAFGFVVHEDFTGPQLQHAGLGEPDTYHARRAGEKISFTNPGQPAVLLAPGERCEIGGNLAVVILDERSAGSGTTGSMPGSYNPFDDVPSARFSGPPADPLTGYGDPFSGSPNPTRTSTATRPGSEALRADPFEAGDVDGYIDPNNPFR